MTRLYLLIAAWFMAYTPLSSQSNISGAWKGVITQNEGGYRSEYSFEMYFRQKGTKITGRSYVYIDRIFAEMELKGEWVDKDNITFTETKITRSKREENMDWCIKSGKLKLIKQGKTWKLEGIWGGVSSFGPCIPGKIFLTKTIPRV